MQDFKMLDIKEKRQWCILEPGELLVPEFFVDQIFELIDIDWLFGN